LNINKKESNRFQRSWNVWRMADWTASVHLYVCRQVCWHGNWINKTQDTTSQLPKPMQFTSHSDTVMGNTVMQP